MPFFAIHYYKLAHKLRCVCVCVCVCVCACVHIVYINCVFVCMCRPSDSSILYALGACYAELNQNSDAKKVGGTPDPRNKSSALIQCPLSTL